MLRLLVARISLADLRLVTTVDRAPVLSPTQGNNTLDAHGLDSTPYAYDPIEHVARLLGRRGLAGSGYLAMLTAVFDASGTDHDQEHVVVAGYLASAGEWSRFAREWQSALAPRTVFHATEERHRLGPAFE